jgi:soluble lytic murein transglycosylase-like protein
VRIALAIALAESNLNPDAVSPKNAQGVMQLIPDTQARFGVTRPFDPESNIRGGLAYLKWLKGRFDGDWSLIAAAYNAGEGAVERHGGIPPYRETESYVQRVLFFAGFSAKKSI